MSEITITPVVPVGAGIQIALGDGSARSVADGGWAAVTRPKRKAGTRWEGQNPYGLIIPCVFDGFRDDRSVEPEIEFLRRMWRVPTPQTGEPPVVQISGPVPLTQLRWVIQNIDDGATEYRGDGLRTRQFFTLDLMEYVPLDVLIESRPASPAQAAVQRATTATATPTPQTQRTYTVKSGDTLSKIAARELGNANRWGEIASLNGLRDPNRISAGQQLRLP